MEQAYQPKYIQVACGPSTEMFGGQWKITETLKGTLSFTSQRKRLPSLKQGMDGVAVQKGTFWYVSPGN